MTVAIQAAFAAALVQAADPAPVYRTTAPQDALDQYVVYALIPGAGPQGHTYGGSYQEDDLYLVSAVARTETDAETLNETIGQALHRAQLDGVLAVRRENRAPLPAPKTNQTRHVAATFYRVKYTGD